MHEWKKKCQTARIRREEKDRVYGPPLSTLGLENKANLLAWARNTTSSSLLSCIQDLLGGGELLSSFSTTVDSRTTSLESLLSMKVAPLLLHNMLLLSALLPYAVKASVFLLHDLHSSIVCIWMHLDNYWQGQHLYRGQPNILYDPIDFKGPSFFAGLQESCLTLFAKLRQSHNLPKLDWHTGSKQASSQKSPFADAHFSWKPF